MAKVDLICFASISQARHLGPTTTGLVPAAARSAYILLVMQSSAGGDNDGLADNLSLVLHNV
jgi:hypothetical protein